MNDFSDMEDADFMTLVQRARRRAQLEDAVTIPRDPIAVRIPEAVAMIGVGRSKLYELIKNGQIETVKVGRSTLVVVASLRAFIANRRFLPPMDDSSGSPQGWLGLDD